MSSTRPALGVASVLLVFAVTSVSFGQAERHPFFSIPVFREALDMAFPLAHRELYDDLAITVRVTRPFDSIPSQISIRRNCDRRVPRQMVVTVYRADNSIVDELYQRSFTSAGPMAEFISAGVRKEEMTLAPDHPIFRLVEQLMESNLRIPSASCAWLMDAGEYRVDVESRDFRYSLSVIWGPDHPIAAWAKEVSSLFNLFPQAEEGKGNKVQ
jgi:hypothetical protein